MLFASVERAMCDVGSWWPLSERFFDRVVICRGPAIGQQPSTAVVPFGNRDRALSFFLHDHSTELRRQRDFIPHGGGVRASMPSIA